MAFIEENEKDWRVNEQTRNRAEMNICSDMTKELKRREFEEEEKTPREKLELDPESRKRVRLEQDKRMKENWK